MVFTGWLGLRYFAKFWEFFRGSLDRCRPDFAIEILEKAKHFFNVKNIVFVLGADKKQLGSSIKSIYGEGLNVNGYLRRFMDFDYVLPPPSKGLFVKALFRKYAFNDYFSRKRGDRTRYEGEQTILVLTELFQLYGLTLREQEHCCSLLSLSIRTTPEDHYLFPIFLCFLIVLKVKEPDLYKALITEEIDQFELLERLSTTPRMENFLSSNYGAALEAHIVTCKGYGYGNNEIYKRRYIDTQNSASASDVEKQRAQKIIKTIDNFEYYGGTDSLSYLLKKIEIASRFKE